ncbi:unnamed protein product [marine sediment metagenome]|uniref:GGDEF domain-containing protein n=1 Tax=marine sediment metagenome TaxID=412755 RepID=X1ASV3_9ZZZZ
MLQQIAHRISLVLTPGAMSFRVGGENFAVLLIATEPVGTELAEKICETVRAEPYSLMIDKLLNTSEAQVTASIGVATVYAEHGEVDQLYEAAGTALYAAKARGCNRVVHLSQLEQEALKSNVALDVQRFEDIAKVLVKRAAESITQHGRLMFEKIRAQADVDGLVGLYNRGYLDRRLPVEYSIAEKESVPITVAMLDIDYFGKVNKTYGWPTGDAVLAQVAERVRSNARADDWIARYGGEEFCIVLLGTILEQARNVLERIHTAIAALPFKATDGRSIAVTASIGAAERLTSDKDVKALMERVSARLLDAKNGGRNRVCL